VLQTIPGVVPGQYDRPGGCLLHPRCAYATERCRAARPALSGGDSTQVRCHFPLDRAGQPGKDWNGVPR